jgi:hypothetical protein
VAGQARAGVLEGGDVRLAAGAHSSPGEGVCAVELASLLAGERFSDHPRCVCRVIAAFMRSLNDRASHADRQRLIPYASAAVGTRGDRELTRHRRELCLAWAAGRPEAGPPGPLARLGLRLRIWVVVGMRQALRLDEGAGDYAARVLFARHGPGVALALLDQLLEAGPEREWVERPGRLEPAPLANPVQGAAQARVAAAVRELAGDPQRANGEYGGQEGDHNGNGRHLGGRYAGQADEEHVEDDHPCDGDPEREPDPAEHGHDRARVP